MNLALFVAFSALNSLLGIVAWYQRERQYKAADTAKDTLLTRLMDRQDDLMDRLQEMIGQIHVHQVRAHAPPSTKVPLAPVDMAETGWISEEEDDLRAMREAEMISADELRAALKDLNFQNSEIEVGFGM